MRPRSLTQLTALALLWGSNYLWIAIALRTFSPVQIAAMRLALGALTLLLILRVGRRRIARGTRLWGQLIIAALLANAIPYSLFAFAERQVASSIAGILTATTPMWTTVIAYAAGTQRRVPATSIAGLAAGLVGTALIFSPWQAAGTIAGIGGLTVLAAAVSYGASYVYMNHHLAHRQLDPLVLAASQLIAATGLLAIVVPFAGLQPLHPHPDALLALITLGVFGTGLAYVVNYRLIASTGTSASVVTYLLPIVAIALGATLHREHATLQALAGTAIILCAVALIRRTPGIPGHRTSPEAAMRIVVSPAQLRGIWRKLPEPRTHPNAAPGGLRYVRGCFQERHQGDVVSDPGQEHQERVDDESRVQGFEFLHPSRYRSLVARLGKPQEHPASGSTEQPASVSFANAYLNGTLGDWREDVRVRGTGAAARGTSRDREDLAAQFAA